MDYGGSYRVFALEVDRGTEPKISPANRKSWTRSIDMYRQVIKQKLYKSHYGLKANLLVMWVFNSRTKEKSFLEMMEKRVGRFIFSILTTSYLKRLEASAGPICFEDIATSHYNHSNGKNINICIW